MRIASVALLLGFAGAAISGCGPAAHYSVTPPPSVALADRQEPLMSTCVTCAGAAQGMNKYPVSALIACGPRLAKHDEATGPVTLGRNHTVVYRSALTGRQVEEKGECEVKFMPRSLARKER